MITLCGYRQNALGQGAVDRIMEGDVAEERMERRQSDVSAAGGIATFLLEVIEEGTDEGGIKILDTHRRWRFLEALLHKGKEHAESVAIARDCMRACLPLVHETVSEECLEQGGESRLRSSSNLLLFQTQGSQLQEFRDGRDVPVRVGDMDVAKIRAQFRHVPFDIEACPIPPEQRLNGESVPEVMEPWAMALPRPPQACPPRQADKLVSTLFTVNRLPCSFTKKLRVSREKPIPEVDVAPECF